MFLAGFVIELGATLIDTWMGRQILSKQSVADEIIKLATGSLMIVLGTCKSHKHRSSYVIPNVTNVLFLFCNINEILLVKNNVKGLFIYSGEAASIVISKIVLLFINLSNRSMCMHSNEKVSKQSRMFIIH